MNSSFRVALSFPRNALAVSSLLLVAACGPTDTVNTRQEGEPCVWTNDCAHGLDCVSYDSPGTGVHWKQCRFTCYPTGTDPRADCPVGEVCRACRDTETSDAYCTFFRGQTLKYFCE